MDQDESKEIQRNQNSRQTLINTITSPIAFFALTLLIAEGSLVAIIHPVGPEHIIEVVRWGASIFLFIISMVSLLVFYKPQAFVFDRDAYFYAQKIEDIEQKEKDLKHEKELIKKQQSNFYHKLSQLHEHEKQLSLQEIQLRERQMEITHNERKLASDIKDIQKRENKLEEKSEKIRLLEIELNQERIAKSGLFDWKEVAVLALPPFAVLCIDKLAANVLSEFRAELVIVVIMYLIVIFFWMFVKFKYHENNLKLATE